MLVSYKDYDTQEVVFAIAVCCLPHFCRIYNEIIFV